MSADVNSLQLDLAQMLEGESENRESIRQTYYVVRFKIQSVAFFLYF